METICRWAVGFLACITVPLLAITQEQISLFSIRNIYEANNIKTDNISKFGEIQSTENTMEASEQPGFSRKGLIIGVLWGIGKHEVYSSDVINSETTIGTKDWSYNSEFSSYTAGITLSAYFANKFGLMVGTEYNSYATSYYLSGQFTDYDSIYTIPIAEGIPVYLNVDADYDSTIYVQTVSFPVQFAMHTPQVGKFGAYIKIGASLSFPIYVSYKANGSYIQNGVMVEQDKYSPITRIYGILADGYTREGNTEGKLDGYSGMSVNLNATIGIEFYLSQSVSLQAGMYSEEGFSDIEPDKSKYENIFHTAFPHEKTSLEKIGVTIGLNYKL